MFGTFNDPSWYPRNRISLYARTQSAKTLYQSELDKLYTYLRERRHYLENQHLVCRLIDAVGPKGYHDPEYLVDMIGDQVGYISRSMDLSSITNFGRINPDSQFFNNKVNEVIILHREYFDVPLAVKNWKVLEPIKVLSHPHTDISYTILNGKCVNPTTGDATISINLPMLLLQYQLWLSSTPASAGYTMSDFVVAYPLANMIKSHADIAIFNRLVNAYREIPNDSFIRSNPLALIDIMPRIDPDINQFAAVLKRRPEDFVTILDNVPVLNASTFIYRCRTPDIAMTRQVSWGILMSRIRLFSFLMEVNNTVKCSANLGFINEIRKTIRELDNSKVLDRGFPQETRDMFNRLLQEVDLA